MGVALAALVWGSVTGVADVAPGRAAPPAPSAPPAPPTCSPPSSGYGAAIRRYVPFHNRYGELIAVDLYLPTDAAGSTLTDAGCQFPVVLESSPYRDWETPQPTKVTEDARRSWWVRRGYVYAFADVPGTGGSDGTWCLFCEHEQWSGFDVVEALGTMPGSNGNVGMIGGSYPGINSLLVAQRQPPHLKAVIAAQFFVDPYSDLYFVGGMRRLLDSTVLGVAFTGLAKWTGQYQAPTSAEEFQRFTDVWTSRAKAPPPSFASIQDDHPIRDDWYEERTVRPEQITVPAYLLGGWNDIFDRATWGVYERLSSAVKVLRQGPFTHVSIYTPPGAWPCASHDSDFCGAPMFDRFLKGDATPDYQAMVATPVKYYVQPSGATPAAPYVEGAAKPATTPWTMALGPPGKTAATHWDPSVGVTSGQWFLRGSVGGAQPPYDYYLGFDSPADQRIEEGKELSVASPPLAHDVTVVGGGSLSLLAASSGTDADVVVRLVDEYPAGDKVFPAGYAYLVTNGWLRASHRSGQDATHIAPLQPGLPTRLDVEVWPAGYRFLAGHRIRVDIAAADVPRFAPLSSPFDLTIDLGASSVTLPTVSSP